MNSCRWTGFTDAPLASEISEKIEQTKAAIAAGRTNLVAYQRRADACQHVIASALRVLVRLDCILRVRTWNLKRARGY